jgi:hypothetical protein
MSGSERVCVSDGGERRRGREPAARTCLLPLFFVAEAAQEHHAALLQTAASSRVCICVCVCITGAHELACWRAVCVWGGKGGGGGW